MIISLLGVIPSSDCDLAMPCNNELRNSIAYTHRIHTEVIKAHKQRWLVKALRNRTKAAQNTYRAQPGWKQDLAVAAAPKKIARQYYQLKTGHAAIGTYLKRIHTQETETCQWCQAPKESTHYLLFECRKWWRQHKVLYQDLARAGITRPTMTEEYPEGRLFENPKASQALLQFLANTTVDCLQGDLAQTADRACRNDKWGLQTLKEAERDREG